MRENHPRRGGRFEKRPYRLGDNDLLPLCEYYPGLSCRKKARIGRMRACVGIVCFF